MKFHKLIALVLSLCLCVSGFSVNALAMDLDSIVASVVEAVDAENAAEAPVVEAETVNSTGEVLYSEEPASAVFLNPLYPAAEVEAMLYEAESNAVMPLADGPSFAEATFDEAVAYYREAVKSRATTIMLSYTTDDYDKELLFAPDAEARKAYANTVIGEIFTNMWIGATEHTGAPDEGDYILWHFAARKVSSSYSSLGNDVTFNMTITMTYYTDYDMEQALEAKVTEVLESLGLDGMSDYEKVCAIYDFICDNVTYDYTHLNDSGYKLKYTAYAALFHGTSVCQGYASLFYNMALRCGIDARLISGYSRSERHGWNIVLLDGMYYSLDATWDSMRPEYEYFLRGSENFYTDHEPDAEFCSAEFYTRFPVSETDYVPRVVPTSGACGDGLTWKLSPNGVLSISGAGTMSDFASPADMPWVDSLTSITSVVVEEGVTSVGSNAFSGCTYLVSVNLPDSLVRIGENAFSGCTGLEKVEIPVGVTEIGLEAFAGNGLKMVLMHSDSCAIGADATTLGEPDITEIHCHKGSTAQVYAEEYGYSSMVLWGDLDNDLELTAMDIMILMKAVAGVEALNEGVNGDLNNDNVVDILDIIRLVRLCAEAAA